MNYEHKYDDNKNSRGLSDDDDDDEDDDDDDDDDEGKSGQRERNPERSQLYRDDTQ